MSEEHVHEAAGEPGGGGGGIDARPAARADLSDVFRRAFEDAPIAMAIVGLDGRILRPNLALVAMVGRSHDELLFMEPGELAHPDDAGLNEVEMRRAISGAGDDYRLEKRWTNAQGHTIWVCISASLVRDERDRPLYFIWHVEDGSARKREQSRLQRLADHDALTGISNRRRFHELLSRQVARSRRYGEIGAVLVLDLDDFKQVNDVFGHAGGDELLSLVARMLSERVRDSDLVARLGGDEFGVVLLAVGAEYAAAIARELCAAIAHIDQTPSGRPVSLRASVGCAMITPAVESADDVIAAADSAMYAAKRAGKSFDLAPLPDAEPVGSNRQAESRRFASRRNARIARS